MHPPRFLSVLTALSAAALMSVGALPSSSAVAEPPAKHFLITAGDASMGLSVMRVHDDGALTPTPGSPFRTGFGILGISVSPDKKKLYVPHVGDGAVSAFRIDDAGSLHLLNTVAVGGAPTGARVTPDGKHLYVVLGGFPGQVATLAITPSGALRPLNRPRPAIGTPSSAVGMASIDPDGRFLRVTSYISTTLTSYALSPNGGARSIGTTPVAFGPVAPGYTPDGRFLYSSDEFGFGLSGFRIHADGSLTPTPGSPYPTGGVPHGVITSPDGKRLYVPNAVGTSIAAYRIHPDGRLTRIAGSPYPGPAGTLCGQVALHPSGKWLYDIDVLTVGITTRITTYRVRADGGLAPTNRPVVDTGVVMSDGPVVALT
ncbi:beta-propeller fold lactonase family protein [Gordonia sp. X0973]|uniref:lactonase family protein n=1 Tax=Gordonia sp. X0973 TaxID=2742602 RepID=UPI000F5272A3|nr:beta-propeller fold lactonase family protein [Gordonia sp. X0973]QKT06639.1 beta-propeller fold lactonase family protein [Gordonia sp. X0973]